MPFEKPKKEVTVWTIAQGVMLGIVLANAIETITAAAWLRIQLDPAIIQWAREHASEKMTH